MKAGLLGFLAGVVLTGLVLSGAAGRQLRTLRADAEKAIASSRDDGRIAGCNAVMARVTPPQAQYSCALADGKLVAVTPLLPGRSQPIEE